MLGVKNGWGSLRLAAVANRGARFSHRRVAKNALKTDIFLHCGPVVLVRVQQVLVLVGKTRMKAKSDSGARP
jgi:hypothetical protein